MSQLRAPIKRAAVSHVTKRGSARCVYILQCRMTLKQLLITSYNNNTRISIITDGQSSLCAVIQQVCAYVLLVCEVLSVCPTFKAQQSLIYIHTHISALFGAEINALL